MYIFWYFREQGGAPSRHSRRKKSPQGPLRIPMVQDWHIFIYSIITSEPLLHLNSIQKNPKKNLRQPGSAVTTAKNSLRNDSKI